LSLYGKIYWWLSALSWVLWLWRFKLISLAYATLLKWLLYFSYAFPNPGESLIMLKFVSIEALMDRNRLFWGSRRGMLELDLILLPFLDNIYPGLEQEDKERYWELLECEDQDMFTWFMRRENPEDPEMLKIVTIIRDNTGMKIEP